jgi:hypothetical protein
MQEYYSNLCFDRSRIVVLRVENWNKYRMRNASIPHGIREEVRGEGRQELESLQVETDHDHRQCTDPLD